MKKRMIIWMNDGSMRRADPSSSLQNVFRAVWSPCNAFCQGQGNEPWISPGELLPDH